VAPRPNITAGRNAFVYTRPMTGLPQGDAPVLLNSSYTVTADIEVPQGGAEGMILTSGGRFGGYGFYLLKGKPVLTVEPGRPEAPQVEGPGRAHARQAHAGVRLQVRRPGRGHARLQQHRAASVARGTGTLKVDGKVVATQTMERHPAR
jgi:arylsulfatase